MPYVTLKYSDAYHVKPLSAEDADSLMQQGHDLVFVDDAVLAAWEHHCNASAAFNTMWRALETAHDAPLKRSTTRDRSIAGIVRSPGTVRLSYECHGCGHIPADHPNPTGCQFWHDKAT